MTPKQRLLAVLAGEIPDRVPATPDVSNMIPARRTGKPFWDIYLYKDPPLWLAYIECVKHFGIDAMLNGFPLTFEDETGDSDAWEECIVERSEERIVTRSSRMENGKRVWQQEATAYRIADPPARRVPVETIGMPEVPSEWEPVEGVKPVDTGPEGLRQAKQAMGDQGLIAGLRKPQMAAACAWALAYMKGADCGKALCGVLSNTALPAAARANAARANAARANAARANAARAAGLL